jgi:hypothetical protein
MYARVVATGADRVRLAEAVELWQRLVAPPAKLRPGLRGERLFAGRQNDELELATEAGASWE